MPSNWPQGFPQPFRDFTCNYTCFICDLQSLEVGHLWPGVRPSTSSRSIFPEV